MDYNFDTLASREGTFCEKYDRREEIFGTNDLIPMWVADMDFKIAPFIKDAMRERATLGEFGYAFRSDSFYSSVRDWVLRRNGWSIENSWISFCPGVVCGIAIAMKAFTAKGDKIVIQPPVYAPFARTIKANERIVVENPLKVTSQGYEIDFDDLDAKLAGSKALILCNPHNPTGRVFTEQELIRIGSLCIKHNVLIFSDEIHSDLIQKPCRHTHIASLSEQISLITLTFISASKSFNLAGLSTSVCITKNEQLREAFNIEFNKLHADQGNVFGTIAMQTAYESGDEWLDSLNLYISKNVDYLINFINTNMPELQVFRSEGTYLIWIDFRAWNLSHDQLYSHLIHKAKLGLDSGTRFGEQGMGFMRMNIGTSLEIIKQALNQLLLSRP